MKKKELWFVYIVRCSDNTLYTGIAKDLEKRIAEHNSTKGGAKYTRARKPVDLAYYEQIESRSAAAKREYQLKRMSLKRKNNLIEKYAHGPFDKGGCVKRKSIAFDKSK